MLVFFGPFTRFFVLLKMSKIKKKRKNVQKIAFFLMLCTTFSNISALYIMLTILHFMPQNKNLKKPKKKLLKLFLKNENWTFIFVHISKLKKSFKKIKRFSVFFQPPKNAFLVFQSTKYRFFGDDFVKLRFFRKRENQPMYVRRFSPVIVSTA
jgi:hypothetical protein